MNHERAFPSVEPNHDGTPATYDPGMTLRDYFAAKAMHALLVVDGTIRFEQRAKEAYDMADAMMKARAIHE
jgi:hypothetical protein